MFHLEGNIIITYLAAEISVSTLGLSNQYQRRGLRRWPANLLVASSCVCQSNRSSLEPGCYRGKIENKIG